MVVAFITVLPVICTIQFNTYDIIGLISMFFLFPLQHSVVDRVDWNICRLTYTQRLQNVYNFTFDYLSQKSIDINNFYTQNPK